MFRQLSTVLIVSLLLSEAHSLDAATRHALVVGVSHYPELDQYLQLKGPQNDVKVVVKLLDSMGFKKQNIIVLAENPISNTLPTAKNIRLAFKKLLQITKPGDFLYMHFSGHGSQQPVNPKNPLHNEVDGLDEIFLPRDVKNWNDAIGAVENAIVDNEINQVVTRLREKNVFVWLVFDSCHAGTMAKDLMLLNSKIQSRNVSPNDLGIPATLLKYADSQAKQQTLDAKSLTINASVKKNVLDVIDTKDPKILAGYIAFYASQSDELTVELKLPEQGQDQQTYGLFTWILYEVITQQKPSTYQSLANGILEKYAEHDIEFTPMFEGDSYFEKLFYSM